MPTAKQTAKYLQYTWDHPAEWLERTLGVRLWGKQRAIVESIRDNVKTAVRSSNAVGKTFLAACLIPWYLTACAPCYVVTTSSNWAGVASILWPQLRRLMHGIKLHDDLGLGGEILQTAWEIGPQWGAVGVSTKTPENFAGFHSPNGVLVIIDEASALTAEISDAILGLVASGGRSRVLMIGNPLRPSGPFYEAFYPSAGASTWVCHHVSALECPNVLEGKQVIPGLASKEWVEDRRAEWGENSPAFRARVLGEFPDTAEDSLIGLESISDSESKVPEVAQQAGEFLRMGVDTARFGDDETVFIVRDEHRVVMIEGHRSWRETEIAGRTKSLLVEFGLNPRNVSIDNTGGYGAGAVDILREQGISVNAVNFGADAYDKEQFANVRAEMYWRLKLAIEAGFSIGDCGRALGGQLAAIRKQYDSKGRIKIEPKENIKKRVGRSPDHADALALTFVQSNVEPFVMVMEF